jgi:hypothetical protein
MKTIIIDFSRGSELKILNTRITSSVTVVSGYYLTLSADDDPVRIASLKLQEEGLLEIPAIIIPAGDLVEKHVFYLPKMPDKEIKKVLPREIAGVREFNQPLVFNYMNNGSIEERQIEKMEIAAFFSLKDRIFEFLNRLKSEGIHPIKIIPEAQGLKTVMEMNPHLSAERKGITLLDLMPNRIDMNIFKGENWGLEREFMFRMESEGDLNEEDFTRISTELTRTFQYFKQRNRSFTVDQVIIYGSSSHGEHLKNLINDNLPVSASIVKPDYFRGKVTMPGHLKESREFLSLFTLPIAAAVATTFKNYLDLFPEEYKEKARMPSRLIGLGISTAIIVAILSGSTFYFQNIKGSYEKDIENIQKTYRSLSKNAAVIEETKAQRVDFYKRRHYIDYPLKYSYTAASLLQRLSEIAPAEVELIEMEMNPAPQSVTFLLTGRIRAGNNIDAQSSFLAFYQELKLFEDILHIESSNVNVNPGEAEPGRSPRKTGDETGTGEGQVELYFTINGEVETDAE